MAPAAAPSEPASPGVGRVLVMPPPWRVALLVAALICAVIVTRNIFSEAHQVIGWAVAASVIALLLAPVVTKMDRIMPRAGAIILTFVLVIALAVGVTWLYTWSILDQVAQIQESGPSIAQEIEDRGDGVGEIAREIGLADQVAELADRLDERTGSGSDAIRSAALSAPPYFVSMILTIFLLLFGPQMINGAIDQLRSARRERFRPALNEAARRSQLYVWASIAQGLLNGVCIWVAAILLDLPAAGLLALVGGIGALIPYLGIVVGWLPVLILGIGVAPGPEVALAAAVTVALQLVEAFWWRRRVDQRSLHVGPAVPVVAAVLGYGIYGIGGALYGCVLAVVALAIADQVWPGTDLPTPVTDPS